MAQTERERNKDLMLLLNKLIAEKDIESIKLLESLVANDTPDMKKSYQIMTEYNLTWNNSTNKSDALNLNKET